MSISFYLSSPAVLLQTLMSAPSETHVETEPAPMWSEALSARARRALSLVQ